MFERETLVPEVEPVVAFLDSMRGLGAEDLLRRRSPWDAFLGAVRARVTAEIAGRGVWRMRQPGRHLHLPLSPPHRRPPYPR